MNKVFRSTSVRLVFVVAVGGLLGIAPIVPASGQTSPACPGVEFMSVDDVRALPSGTTGYGLTVARGRTPEQFSVEILGVLDNGILPGRDMIIIEASSPAIDRAGGIWAGMSGSPVYVNDQLVGAVAYGLSFGPSAIGGLTPAQDMMRLLEHPSATSATTRDVKSIEVSSTMRKKIARETGVSVQQVGGSFTRLKVPVGVSGGVMRKPGKVRRALHKLGIKAVPYAAASTSGSAAAAGTFEPGGNFAAALSYGDLTIAGVGTTTVVCDGKALAFGHPFTFGGRVSMGAGTADALTVVDDPVFGPFKLANIDPTSAGTLDQDRLAGVRAVLGSGPARIPIASLVEAPDNPTVGPRAGETDALESEPVPFLAFLHLLFNIDSRFDQISAGTSGMTWRVEGRDASGDPWSFERRNLFASEWDISYQTAGALEGTLYSLFYNDFEDISFTSVEASPVSVTDKMSLLSVTGLKVSVDGGRYRTRKTVRVEPGARVRAKIVLTGFEDDSIKRVVRTSFRVPRRARKEGVFRAYGAGGPEWCFRACSSSKVESFEEMIEKMESAPTNNMLGTKVSIGGYQATGLQEFGKVVKGRKVLQIEVVR